RPGSGRAAGAPGRLVPQRRGAAVDRCTRVQEAEPRAADWCRSSCLDPGCSPALPASGGDPEPTLSSSTRNMRVLPVVASTAACDYRLGPTNDKDHQSDEDTRVRDAATAQMSRPEVPITASVHPARRLYRRLDDRVVAGVASGIAAHLGVPVVAVRMVFVVMLGLSGLGALLYAVYWAVLPVQPEGEARHTKRNWGQVLPYTAIAIGVLMIQSRIGWGGVNAAIGWLIAITAVGAAIVWHQV